MLDYNDVMNKLYHKKLFVNPALLQTDDKVLNRKSAAFLIDKQLLKEHIDISLNGQISLR